MNNNLFYVISFIAMGIMLVIVLFYKPKAK